MSQITDADVAEMRAICLTDPVNDPAFCEWHSRGVRFAIFLFSLRVPGFDPDKHKGVISKLLTDNEIIRKLHTQLVTTVGYLVR